MKQGYVAMISGGVLIAVGVIFGASADEPTPLPEPMGGPEHRWSTYLGGETGDGAFSVAVDGEGNIYALVGYVPSGTIPVLGALAKDSQPGGDWVVKLSPDGEHRWTTHVGGQFDMGVSIAVDAASNVYVTGLTVTPDWTSGGWDTTYEGTPGNWLESDGFLVKLSADGTHQWSTYLGGSGSDFGCDVAVDTLDNVYVVGVTHSVDWMSGVPGTTAGGSGDTYVVKFTSSGDHLWSTCLGGSGPDEAHGVAVDGSGKVYVSGATKSAGWVAGGWSLNYGGLGDGYVVALNSNGTHWWSTYLGGSEVDLSNGVAVDDSGSVYVTGSTKSSGWLSGGWDRSFGGESDSFLVKLSADGAHVWSTFLGASAEEQGFGIALDNWGNIYATGFTRSASWTSGGWNTLQGGSADGYLVKLSPEGAHLWSSFLGAQLSDFSYGVAVDGSGNVCAAGYTCSPDWTSAGWDTALGGLVDGFVVKLSQTGAPVVFAAPDAVGHARGDAEDAVTGAGVSVGLVTELYHESVPVGQVISQSVPPGTPMEPGTMIDLVVSMGPDPSQTEGSGEGDGEGLMNGPHCADQDGDYTINLTELLRVIQFFNVRGYQCVTLPATSEDGYLPGTGEEHACAPHTSDYSPQDWQINLTELLRLIQFFNLRAYHPCPEMSTEDGYCPGAE